MESTTLQTEINQDDINQLEPHLYTEWQDKIVEDGMFDDNDCPAEWHITSENADEFLEALYIHEWISSEEIIKLVEEYGINEDGEK